MHGRGKFVMMAIEAIVVYSKTHFDGTELNM
jgi:hypothetical protein